MTGTGKLGKFEIRRELGKGAMGVVYEGHDPMIDRTVAIKTILAENLAGADAAEQLARFRREAQAAGRLTHPNIVAIYDFGEDAGTYYIAMEYVKGRELQSFLDANERFPIDAVVRVMGQLLDALDYSHRNGVVHRDVKPSNVIILPDGSVKVADFGIARIDSSNLTQAGTVMGTPSYMSPEQFMGQTVDGRSDLFSAGVILYQLLTGERPFTGSLTTIMHKVLKEDPLPPSTLNVQVPPAFDAVMRRALAKRPDERYQSAREFADAIRQAAAAQSAADATLVNLGATLPGSQPTRVQRPAQAVGADRMQRTEKLAAQTGTVAPAPPPRKSQLPAVAVLGAVIAVAVAGGAWYALTQPGEAPTTAQPAPAPAQPAPTAAPSPPATAAAAPQAPAAPPAAAVTAAPGTVVVSALGLADPTNPRYKDNQPALVADLRADSRSQAVEKAIGLYLQQASLSEHYDRLRDKLLARSGDYIATVVQESEPKLGKDGLMSVTTQAVVKSRELQKSLNEMSREERISFIRTNGDPRVAVRITTRDADDPNAPAQASAIAENLLKERIKSFGFRTWSEDGGGDKPADFSVIGEARIKRLSAKLAASGLTVTKYTLTSWTVKCVDRATGEEIYFNNTLPKGVGSWTSEEEALKAIGTKIADEFNRDFFLQHFAASGQKVVLKVTGLDDPASADLFARELIGLGSVLSSTPRAGASPRTYDLLLSGGASPAELVANGILKPLNAKLGAACFALGPVAGEEVTVALAPSCDKSVLGRLETAPPAGLYSAPPSRQRSVVKNPETLKLISI
ncbi:MAG: serine/threonine protein kinase [Burkholderiales bacterium]|jgi:serine/threonine-protein kinase|nr:serine/threonine protein kinase [Burkholderiales bacterium]